MLRIVGEVYVVGRLRDTEETDLGWDFVGTFTQWDLAEASCRDALDFIARTPLDPAIGVTHELDAFFPHAEPEGGVPA